MLSVIPAKQLQDMDLGLVPPRTHCRASAELPCFSEPQYSTHKIEVQIGGCCQKTATLAPNVPEPLQLVHSDAVFSGKGKWVP